LTYPPLAPPASPILPAPVLIPKTATPVSPTAPHSAPGGNQIGG